jgi:DNA-binding NarL/FixJ family response regulator
VSTESTAATSLRLLLVDGHPGFLQAALHEIRNDKRVGSMMSVQSGREAIEQVTAWSPDLVVMEITLPDGNGFDVGRSIKAVASAATYVVLMTVYETNVYSQAAVSAGLDGVINKGDFSAQLWGVVDRLCAV